MNWEAVSAIGQVVGAAAVVISLIYLTNEVRNNARATRLASMRSLSDAINQYFKTVAEDAGLAELWFRGIYDFDSIKGASLGPAYEDTLARIEAHFGDKEKAIAAVQRLLSTPYASPVLTPALLRIDPDWDNLRGDPRFEKLCQEK